MDFRATIFDVCQDASQAATAHEADPRYRRPVGSIPSSAAVVVAFIIWRFGDSVMH